MDNVKAPGMSGNPVYERTHKIYMRAHIYERLRTQRESDMALKIGICLQVKSRNEYGG